MAIPIITAIVNAASRVANAAKKAISTVRKQRELMKTYDKQSARNYRKAIDNVKDIRNKNRQTARKIGEVQGEVSYEENKRLTKMQEAYFRQSRKTPIQKESGEPLNVQQELIRQQANFVYSKTRVLWMGGDEVLRNENIVAGLSNAQLKDGSYVRNFKDAVQWVKEQYPDEYPTLDKIMKQRDNKVDTLSDTEFNGEYEYEETSPPPISRAQFEAMGIL